MPFFVWHRNNSGFKYSRVVHQYKPMQYQTGDAQTTVVGNWIRDFSYAVFDGEKVELKYFE